MFMMKYTNLNSNQHVSQRMTSFFEEKLQAKIMLIDQGRADTNVGT